MPMMLGQASYHDACVFFVGFSIFFYADTDDTINNLRFDPKTVAYTKDPVKLPPLSYISQNTDVSIITCKKKGHTCIIDSLGTFQCLF